MEKILIAMSGGVDSSVAALILKKQGYEVLGVTMNLFNNENAVSDSKVVCDKLNIEHKTIDYSFEFNSCVINYFINEYLNCKTPNPCVMCNKKIKFGLLYEFAKKNGCKFIATGHYAKVEYSEKYNRYVLKKADNLKKDQSYFLYNLKKEMLPYILFPLSTFQSKDEIRDVADKNNIITAHKKDSQDICFIKDGDYKKFLKSNVNNIENKGNIILNGQIIGVHNGLYKYTIGQRKGLGISHLNPLYVIGFNKDFNELIVGEEKDLYVKSFKVKDYNLLLIDELLKPLEVDVKTRYKSRESKAIISLDGEYINVEFLHPQKGVTSGQSAVFYIDDIVLGGGIIE